MTNHNNRNNRHCKESRRGERGWFNYRDHSLASLHSSRQMYAMLALLLLTSLSMPTIFPNVKDILRSSDDYTPPSRAFSHNESNGAMTKANERITAPACRNNETMTGDVLILNISSAQNNNTKMVNTPAKNPRNNTALCRIEENKMYEHFPHYMQFILRCWSFFQLQAKETNIIIVPDAKYHGKSSFQTGINDVLLKLGIQIEIYSKMRPYFGQGNNSSSVSVGISSGFFVASPVHAKEFRRQFMVALDLFDPSNDRGAVGESSTASQLIDKEMPKIAILNRKNTRSLLNVDDIAKSIKEELNMTDTVAVVGLENSSFIDQVKFFSEHDIVVSPHGAQLTGIIFMPENGAILEIFPLGYVIQDYFGSLSAPIGLEHAYIYETNGNLAEETAYWTANLGRRGIARRRNLCLSVPKIVEGVKLLVKNWRKRHREENALRSSDDNTNNVKKLSYHPPSRAVSHNESNGTTTKTKANERITAPACRNNETMTGDVLILNISSAQNNNTKMVNTPAKNPRNNTALCRIEENKMYEHFPHYMQFILRCWSFFQMQAKETNIIIVPDAKYHGKSSFQTGINDVLLKLGIQIETYSMMRPYFGQGNNSSSVSVGNSFGFFVASPVHAKEFRRQFMVALDLFAPSNDRGAVGESSTASQLIDKEMPKIAILNRKNTRSLLNVDEIAKSIQEELNMTDSVAVVGFENSSFVDQVKFFSEHDIVISPHGAQLTGIIFMPENGAILEIFPLGYVIQDYFGSLSVPIGLEHAYIYETNGNLAEETAYWTANLGRRGIARRRNLCLSVPKIVEGVKLLVKNWRKRHRGESITTTTKN